MTKKHMPRYPIYVPSKGRSDRCLTAKFLIEDEVPFRLVVEPQERDQYAAAFGSERVLVLPFSNRGSVIPARNWIKEHATKEGHERHWQLDDNIRWVARFYRRLRLRCRSGVAFAAIEDFVDRYENVAIAGMDYTMFMIYDKKPFVLNAHVYSCSLVLNSLPHKWRGKYNEDTDICLQVLAGGWCTIQFKAFLIYKMETMLMKGGNTDAIYQDDGRLKMARSLERLWPGVVETKRRFGRPQHHVHDSWKKFDTPLKRKPGIDFDGMKPNEYGMELKQVKPIKTEIMRKFVEQAKKRTT